MSEAREHVGARVQPQFAPRGIGRILDRAFELYRANFRTIAIGSLVVLFPLAMLAGVTQVFSTRGLLEIFGSAFSGAEPGADFFADYGQFQRLSMLSNTVAPLLLLARTYLAACVLAMAPAMLAGEKPGVRTFLKSGWSRFGWLVLTALAVSAASYFGLLLFIVPGVVLYVRLSVARVATVVEGVAVDKAFTRSWGLTRDVFWRTVGFIIVVGALAVVVEAAIDSPAVIRQIVDVVNNPESLFRELSPAWQTFEGVLAAASTSLIAPFVELAWFSYYLDLRARGEGLDLVASAGALAAEEPRS